MTPAAHAARCRHPLWPDAIFNRDMELYGLPQRHSLCSAGHSVTVGVPDLRSLPAVRDPDQPQRASKG